MSKIKAASFDQDGVIIDTERDGHRVSFNLTFGEFGFTDEWSTTRVQADPGDSLQFALLTTYDSVLSGLLLFLGAEAADRRRVARLCAVLDEFPGDLPVELCFRVRDAESRFARGAVDGSRLETLVPRLKALLGVLGDAVEAGDAEPARRDPGLIAVGGA